MESKLVRGSEVRKLHIIYFLSHMGGSIEQPHLIRVHHITRFGVYLRDVKRWLGELRGKEMPEAYSWSYKRRYKTGYVWQDLVDDDLITPLSDNEFVLKGSEIIFSSNNDQNCDEPKKLSNSIETEKPNMHSIMKSCIEEEKQESPSRIFSEINGEESSSFGSDRSCLTDELNVEAEKPSYNEKVEKKCDDKKKKKKSKLMSESERVKKLSLLRNIMSCGAVDTNDGVFVTLRRPYNQAFANSHTQQSTGFTTNWDHQNQNHNSSTTRKNGDKKKDRKNQQRSAYMPIGEPNCSQCGKSFKPAKLHSHMKSCKGMKVSVNSSICGAFTDKTSVFNHSKQGSTNSKESALGYLLTN